jgi:hypothetical protein
MAAKKKPAPQAPANVSIYALHDPESMEIRYVGKANDAGKRLAGHLRTLGRRTPVYDWIRGLAENGRRPVLSILATVSVSEWESAERALIAKHRQGGRLLNVADGGHHVPCPLKTRSANGRRSAEYWADPINNGNRRVLRKTGELIKRATQKGNAEQLAKLVFSLAVMRQRIKIDPEQAFRDFATSPQLRCVMGLPRDMVP